LLGYTAHELCEKPFSAMSSPQSATTDRTRPRPAEASYSVLCAAGFVARFAALAIIVLIPLALTRTLPLFDYPNHMARMHILANWASSAELQRFYAIEWKALPNLAMDAVVPALAAVLPMALAGKIFVALAMLSIPLGVALLHRALFQRWSVWPLMAFLLVYSRFLLWGFLNFLVGTGLSLIAIAAWVAWRERRPALAVTATGVIALGVYFSHLAAFGALGAAIGAYELGALYRARALVSGQAVKRLAIVALPFIAPIFLFLTGPSNPGGPIVFSHFARKLDLPFSLFNNYSRGLDGVTAAAFVLLIAVGFWRGWFRLAKPMALPLAALGLLYLVMPNQIYTASSVDHRLPLVIALILIASIEIAAVSTRHVRIGAALGFALLVARIGVVESHWRGFDPLYAEYQAALDRLPVGAKLAVAHPVDGVRINSSTPPLLHFPLVAVTDRDAFVPALFAFASQQPVAFQPGYDRLARVSPAKLWGAYVNGQGEPGPELASYDYVAFAGTAPFALASSAGLTPEFQSPLFQLYRIVK
jgi:hypothetical protein